MEWKNLRWPASAWQTRHLQLDSMTSTSSQRAQFWCRVAIMLLYVWQLHSWGLLSRCGLGRVILSPIVLHCCKDANNPFSLCFIHVSETSFISSLRWILRCPLCGQGCCQVTGTNAISKSLHPSLSYSCFYNCFSGSGSWFLASSFSMSFPKMAHSSIFQSLLTNIHD